MTHLNFCYYMILHITLSQLYLSFQKTFVAQKTLLCKQYYSAIQNTSLYSYSVCVRHYKLHQNVPTYVF